MSASTDGSPAPAAAAAVFGAALPLAERYVALLASRGVEWGLVGPHEQPRLWDRHVLNSVAVASAIPDASLVLDVGSGAGMPGIPLALVRPDLRITLLEPLARRVRFLEMATDELDLADRVRIVRGRAEDHREAYDVVTCRAVAPLTRLLSWTAPLFCPGGSLVALKGESADTEVASAAKELRKRRLSARVQIVQPHPDVEATRLVIVS